jgi:hypothetical protein
VFEFHTARRGNTVNFVAIADLGLVNAVIMPSLQRLAASHKYDFLTLSGDQVYLHPLGGLSYYITKLNIYHRNPPPD